MSISATRKKKSARQATLIDTQNDSPDEIRDRIELIEQEIEKLKLTSVKRESMFKNEIIKYQAAVKKKKIEAETQLSRLRETFDNEIKELEESQSIEIEEMKQKIKDARSNTKNFSTHRRNLLLARKEAERTELKQQIDLIVQANKSLAVDNSVTIRQRNMKNVQREAAVNEQIELMKMKIADLKTSIQNNLLLNTKRIRETNFMYKERAEKNQAKLERMQQQYEHQKQNNEAAIADYMKGGQATIEKYKNELDNVKQRGKGLIELKEKLAVKHKRQIQDLKTEIDNATDAISQTEERVNEQKEDILKQEDKLNAIIQDNLTIDGQIEDVREDIASMKSENQALRKELNRLRNNHYQRRFNQISQRDDFV